MFKRNLEYVAVAFHFRNILNRVNCKSDHLTKNFRILTNHDSKINIPQLLGSQVISRNLSSPVKIQPYQSSRKNTLTWKIERLMGWSLIVLIPMVSAIHSKGLEMLLSAVVLIHTYLGCQSMCSDYLRSANVGKLLPVIVRLFIVMVTVTSFVGAYQLIYADIGLRNLIKKVWSIRGPDYKPPMRLQKVNHHHSKS